MSEKFLHGPEVVEIDSGPRPIQTVRSSIIGIVGTAPDSAPATPATLTTGNATFDTAITFTAVSAGLAGNNISIAFTNPDSASASLSVSVTGTAIVVNLATDATGALTSTASDVVTAINGSAEAAALVTAASAVGSDGSGVVLALKRTLLTGGAAEPFPLNVPSLVAGSRAEAAALGSRGTLPQALEGIFDQAGAVVIVVRVEEGADEDATMANIIGGVNATTGQFEGLHALAGAKSVVGFQPRILCTPGFSHQRPEGFANPVVAEALGIAERLRAVFIADGPNTTDDAAQAYAADWGSPRVYMVDPWVMVSIDGEIVSEPPSARVAGLIAKIDNDRGFWWSPSNNVINGIIGTARPVDFTLGDANSRANLLNERGIATVINQDGYRLWGNRTLTDDTKWIFLSVRRTADIINDSILRAHLWAVDRNITKTYVEDVEEGVNDYIARLKALGAVLGGRCWADPDLNTPANVQLGKVYFNFDFTPPYPAEHITFRSLLVNDYIEEVFE
ncbi:phage tail sheath subtilisin-like domain-containing protein [Halomonas sp. V046]|uniref:phage tail sheath subtilisin-like domain-containing protein n=1 Tax=Halomonas sp. V046 TaxID=3459611 RepID=UPI004045159A